MKIVYLDAFPLGNDIDTTPLMHLGDYTSYDRSSDDEIVERSKEATILLTNKCKLSKEVLLQLPNLKYIGVTATGFNIVDTVAAKELGIVVCNASDYSTNAVAQHVFSMLLEITNKVASYENKNKWAENTDFCYFNSTISELAGKTFGVIGYGNIGKKVVQIAEAFGMKCLINKRKADNQDERVVNLKTLLEKCDYISLHLPLSTDNQQFVNKSLISQMKPNAILINTARGGLINENELAEALKEGLIMGAALDVLTAEPPEKNNPLLTTKNCLITPHIAWGSYEARTKLLDIVVENIKAYQQGKPQNVVN